MIDLAPLGFRVSNTAMPHHTRSLLPVSSSFPRSILPVLPDLLSWAMPTLKAALLKQARNQPPPRPQPEPRKKTPPTRKAGKRKKSSPGPKKRTGTKSHRVKEESTGSKVPRLKPKNQKHTSVGMAGPGGAGLSRLFGPTKRTAYLDALRTCPVIRSACDVAGVSRSTIHNHREADPDFALAEERAKKDGIERLEADVMQRANSKDVEKPSDLLSIFMLKAHKPGLYRDKIDHRVEGTVTHEVTINLVPVVPPGDVGVPTLPHPDVIEGEVIEDGQPESEES